MTSFAIGKRASEVQILLSPTKLYCNLNDYAQALYLCQQALAIASDLSIPLKAECETLIRELTGEE